MSPVRDSPSPMTKSAAMSTTFGSANPDSVSGTVSTPVSGSATSSPTATTSIRGRLIANITIDATSRASTTSSCQSTLPQ